MLAIQVSLLKRPFHVSAVERVKLNVPFRVDPAKFIFDLFTFSGTFPSCSNFLPEPTTKAKKQKLTRSFTDLLPKHLSRRNSLELACRINSCLCFSFFLKTKTSQNFRNWKQSPWHDPETLRLGGELNLYKSKKIAGLSACRFYHQ